MTPKIKATLSAITILLLGSCEKFNDPDSFYTYHPPTNAEKGVNVSSLQAEGMDEALITQMTNKIFHEEYERVDAVLILRNNKLVYEEYFHGFDKAVEHNMFSAGKSVSSILTGIAIDKGFIENVNVPIVELLPEYSNYKNPDVRKNNITIEHLLNMTSGLDCDDWVKHTDEQMSKSKDGVKFTLDLPMASDPGTNGSYCTGCALLLGKIIENQSKMDLSEFADKYLFGPLDIKSYRWSWIKDGEILGAGHLFLRPRDMAKIGSLMLNEGSWNNERIVSKEWVSKSSQNLIKIRDRFDGYGYLWWKLTFKNNIETYFASGNGGQDIFVIPSQNMVVVFTTGNKNTSLGLNNFNMMSQYILPAIQ